MRLWWPNMEGNNVVRYNCTTSLVLPNSFLLPEALVIPGVSLFAFLYLSSTFVTKCSEHMWTFIYSWFKLSLNLSTIQLPRLPGWFGSGSGCIGVSFAGPGGILQVLVAGLISVGVIYILICMLLLLVWGWWAPVWFCGWGLMCIRILLGCLGGWG